MTIAETQASLPQTPINPNITGNNGSSDSGHAQSSSSAIANAFDADLDASAESTNAQHQVVDNKLNEMQQTIYEQQRKVNQMFSDSIFWKTKVWSMSLLSFIVPRAGRTYQDLQGI